MSLRTATVLGCQLWIAVDAGFACHGTWSRIQAHLNWLQAALKHVNRALQKQQQTHPIWSFQTEWLHSVVPGVGPVVTAVLVSELSELGHLSSRQLAPMDRDSGQLRGQQRILGSRASVRRILLCGHGDVHPLQPKALFQTR